MTATRKIILMMSVSLDGFIEGPDRQLDWQLIDADPASTAPMVEFAGIWRDMPKIVYSRTLERADWNTTIVRDVVVEKVLELKRSRAAIWRSVASTSPRPSCDTT